MKALLLALGLILAAQTSSAAPAGPVWFCNLVASNVHGKSVGLGFNLERLEGTGYVNCSSVNGYNAQTPVSILIKGIGIGLGFSKTTHMDMITTNVGVGDPSEMLGSFKLGALAGGVLIAGGLGVDVSLSAAKQGLGLEVGLIGVQAKGLEAKLQGRSMRVQPIGETIYWH